MVNITSLTPSAAKAHFLKGESYFNSDTPPYMKFDALLKDVKSLMGDESYSSFQKSAPAKHQDVNYRFITNKDGRFAWRQLELIHPVIYVSIVNLICKDENWNKIKGKFEEFSKTCISCASIPQISVTTESDKALQVQEWWTEVEQESLKSALDYRYVCSVDVADCYGSLYTHSISWALDGYHNAKLNQKRAGLGAKIDQHIMACRFGQTNGIPQGSMLSDFIAEIILGYVDTKISEQLKEHEERDFSIIRYRDDYRIFTNNARTGELIVQKISQSLIDVGMRLNTAKTIFADNVISNVFKPDKMEALHLSDIGTGHAKTIQKQLLRIHALNLAHPNSGSVNKLLTELFRRIVNKRHLDNENLPVLLSILTDMALISPKAIPAISAIMTCVFQKLRPDEKSIQWKKVTKKIQTLPNNSFQQIWIQRIAVPSGTSLRFESTEKLCKVVNNEKVDLWNSLWIDCEKLRNACDPKKIIVSDPNMANIIASSEEFDLFPEHS